MRPSRPLGDSAPEAEGAARHSPSALRNAAPITDLLRTVLPPSGLVLEIASGTGEHAVHFARAFPELHWQPSDPDDASIASIAAHAGAAKLPNLSAPLRLDVTGRPWPVARADAAVCINMIHISPWAATVALMEGAGSALVPGAPLVLYGPFLREGVETAPGNVAFDADLRRRDPRWGLRDLGAVAELASRHGLDRPSVHEMPANNLMLVFRRAAR